jgi:hypothetical protein
MNRKDALILGLIILAAVTISRLAFVRRAIGRMIPLTVVERLFDSTYACSPSTPFSSHEAVSFKRPPEERDKYNKSIHHQKVSKVYADR